jgi:hypothetical protein
MTPPPHQPPPPRLLPPVHGPPADRGCRTAPFPSVGFIASQFHPIAPKLRGVRDSQAVAYAYPSTAPALGVRFSALRDTRPLMPCSGLGDRVLGHRSPPLPRICPNLRQKTKRGRARVFSRLSTLPFTLLLLVAAFVGEARCSVERQHEPSEQGLFSNRARCASGAVLCHSPDVRQAVLTALSPPRPTTALTAPGRPPRWDEIGTL